MATALLLPEAPEASPADEGDRLAERSRRRHESGAEALSGTEHHKPDGSVVRTERPTSLEKLRAEYEEAKRANAEFVAARDIALRLLDEGDRDGFKHQLGQAGRRYCQRLAALEERRKRDTVTTIIRRRDMAGTSPVSSTSTAQVRRSAATLPPAATAREHRAAKSTTSTTTSASSSGDDPPPPPEPARGQLVCPGVCGGIKFTPAPGTRQTYHSPSCSAASRLAKHRQGRAALLAVETDDERSTRLIRKQSNGTRCAVCGEWLAKDVDPDCEVCGFCRAQLEAECGLDSEMAWLDLIGRALDLACSPQRHTANEPVVGSSVELQERFDALARIGEHRITPSPRFEPWRPTPPRFNRRDYLLLVETRRELQARHREEANERNGRAAAHAWTAPADVLHFVAPKRRPVASSLAVAA